MKIGHFRRVTVICWMSQKQQGIAVPPSKRILYKRGDKMCGFYWHFNRAGYFAALVLVQVIAKSKPVRKTVIRYLCRALRFAGRKSIRYFDGCALLPLNPLSIGVSAVGGIPGVTTMLLLI